VSDWQPKRFFKVGVVANLLGVSSRTVATLFDTGVFKGHRLSFGRHERRISRESVVAFAESNEGMGFVLEQLEAMEEAE
jgi:excisionase family DNA binding protein